MFSAADYPQFQFEDDDTERYNNKGAIVVLQPPAYCEFTVKSYSAAPRPAATCFCDPEVPDSADEMPECSGPISDCDVSGACGSGGRQLVPDIADCFISAPSLLNSIPDEVKAEVKHVLVSTAVGAMQCSSDQMQEMGRGQRNRVLKRPR